MKKCKKIVSLILAFVMTASLFSNWPMPAFATDGTGETVVEGDVTPSPSPSVEPSTEPSTEPVEESTPSPSPSPEATESPIATVADEGDAGVELVEKTMIDAATGIQVNVTIPEGALLTVSPWTLPAASVENGLIWNNALFYKVEFTYNGAAYTPEKATVVIPEGTTPFTTGEKYSKYYVDATGKVTPGTSLIDYTGGDVSIDMDGDTIIGVAKDLIYSNGNVSFVTDTDESYAGFTGTFANSSVKLYSDYGLIDSVSFTTADTDIFVIDDKATITYGDGQTADVYTIYEYQGENADMGEAIWPSDDTSAYYIVLCSDVEEYVEPPVFEDISYTDETTGITVSGSLPQGTTIKVEESTLAASGLDTNAYPVGKNTMVYNVSLTYKNREYQPEDGSEIYVELPESEVEFGFAAGYMVYQVDEENVDVIGPVVYTGGSIHLPMENLQYLVYTDTFESASNVVFKAGFTSNFVTFYEAPFEGAATHSIDNALDHFTYVEFSYTDADGVTWHEFYNDFVDCENEYLYVKGSDIKKVLTDEVTGITVTGPMPVGVNVSVTAVDNAEDIIDTSKYALGNDTVAYDISLAMNGEEYQPESAVDVTFPASLFSEESGTYYTGYHIHDDTVEKLGNYQYTGEDVVVSVDSFSYLLLTTASEEELVARQMTDAATGVQVNATVPNGALLTVSKWTTPEANATNGLIWNNSLFYSIEITYNDETFVPEDAVVIFPVTMLPFTSGETYSHYTVGSNGKPVFEYGFTEYTGEQVSATWDGTSVIGIAKDISYENGNVAFESDATGEYTGFTGAFANEEVRLYSDFGLTEYVSFTIAETDLFYVYDKVTITYGDGQTVDAYLIGSYAGANDDMAEAISPTDGSYPCEIVLCSDVEEYTGTSPFENTVLEDPFTGVTVSGTLPADTELIVTPITDMTEIDLGSYPLGDNVVAYDISLSYNGTTIQPNHEVYVEIPESNIPFEFATGFVLYHIHEENGVEEIEVTGPVVYTGGFLNLPTTSFSQFVLTDAFVDASNVPFKAGFNSNFVTFYTSPFADAATYTVDNALDLFAYVEFSYTEADGTVWYEFSNEFVDCDSEYLFVKGTDVHKVGEYTGESATDFTQVGALRKTATVTAMPAVYDVRSLLTTSYMSDVMAVDEESGTTPANPDADGNGLVINKSVSEPDENGVYTITLEAYVTGEVEIKRQSMPTDIILVLDQSGSMDDTFGGQGYHEFTNTAQNAYNNYRNNLYVKDGDDYVKVTVTANSETVETYTVHNRNNQDETNSWYYNNNRSNNLYHKDGDNYYKVTITREVIYNGRDGYYRYTYTYVKDGQTITLATSDYDNGDPGLTLYGRSTQTTYTGYTFTPAGGTGVTYGPTENLTDKGYYYYGSDNRSKLQVLKDTVTDFATAVQADANGDDGVQGTADDVDHHLAIVGFASGNLDSGTDYENMELFVGGTQYQYGGNSISNQYGNALQDMNTEAGVNNITASIADLDAEGGTYVDLGIEMANNIFAAETSNGTDYSRYITKNADGSTTVIRNRVVIVFTDGAPGYNGTWGGTNYGSSGDAKPVAEAALTNAVTTKRDIPSAATDPVGYGATLYTIGIFSGANAEISVNTAGTEVTLSATDNSNKFMHYLSSNYKSASGMDSGEQGTQTFPKDDDGKFNGDSYYLSASNSAALSEIFDKISTSISGSSNSQLTESTVVRDIISPYFTLPVGTTISNIGIKTQEAVFTSGTLTGWSNDVTIESTADNVEIDGKTINVTGFNFKENYVASTARSITGDTEFYGRRLVITLPIVVEDNYLGGNGTPTNGALSGVYADKDTETAVEAFPLPTVDVAVKEVVPETIDQYIYATNTADLRELFTGSHVEGQDTILIADGVNNAYVTLEYTIKDADGKTIGTYFLDKGVAFRNEDGTFAGTWTPAEGQTLTDELLDDETYTIVCKVDGTNGGTTNTSVTDPAVDASVYVFKPVLTFKDSVAYLGDADYPTISDASNLVSKVWTNATKGNAAANPMTGSEPGLTITYEQKSGAVTQTDDVEINVTSVVRADDASVSVPATYAHNNCDGATCTLNGAELLIHVYSPALQLKDSNVYYGGAVPSTDFTGNIVEKSLIWSNDTLGEAPNQPAVDVTATDLPAAIDTTADIPVTVKLTRADNNSDITTGTTITHKYCATTETHTGANILLHVLVPSYTFADAYVHLGATVPAEDVLADQGTSNGWVVAAKSGVLADNYANTAPKVTVNYVPAETGVITDKDDIGVDAIVKADNVDVTDVSKITKGTHATDEYEFALHVNVPEYTFKDVKVYLGSTITDAMLQTGSVSGPVWAEETYPTEATYLTDAPAINLTYTSNPPSGAITTNSDIPVNVTAAVNGTEITGHVVKHQDCDNTIGALGTTAETSATTWPTGAEFVLHVFTPTFVTKDTFVYLGSTVPTDEQYDANNIGVPSWSHPSGLSIDGIYGDDAPEATFDFVTDASAVSDGRIFTTENDVKVTVTVSLDGNEVSNDYITITHDDCDNVTDIELTEDQFLLHVLKPYVTFEDRGVYYGNAWPTDAEINASNPVLVEWQYADTDISTIDGVAAPTLAYTYTYAKAGDTINTKEDIAVDAHISIAGVDADAYTTVKQNMCDIKSETTDATDFLLHVFVPEVTFEDDNAFYGDVVPSIDDNLVADSEKWWHNTVDATTATAEMLGEKPTLTIETSVFNDKTYVVDDYIALAETIPVNAVVKIGDMDITSITDISHKDCENTTNETAADTWPTDAEFVIHVDTVSLDVSKVVSGVETDEEFTVIVTYDGNIPSASLTIIQDNATASITTDADGNGILTLSIAHDETISLTGLPVGTYKVAENNYEPKYLTATEVTNGTVGDDNRSAVLELTKDVVSGTVTFTNSINLTSLTIHKVATGNTYNVKDSFIFNVYEGTDITGDPYATVILQSGDYISIPDLVVGTVYTVVEETGWSWRYENTASTTPAANKLVYDTAPGTANARNLYSFTNEVTELYWLDNESQVENQWKASGVIPSYNYS